MDSLPWPVVVAMLGGVAWIAGVLMRAHTHEAQSLGRMALSLPRLTAGEVAGRQPLPERVAVVGRTVAGPQGLVRGQLSGADCVWFRVAVHRVDTVGSNEGTAHRELYATAGGADPVPVADDTGKLYLAADLAGQALLPRVPALAEAVVDEHTPHSAARPVQAQPHLAELLRVGALPPDRLRAVTDTREFQVTEHVVRPDQRVLVVGRPRRTGDVVLIEASGPGSGTTVLTDSEIAAYVAKVTASLPARLCRPLVFAGLVAVAVGVCAGVGIW